MDQEQEGLFVIEDQMPCSPEAITICQYVLPSTFNKAEQEEAAARIIFFSQQLGRWVGVSWRRIAEIMQNDYDAYRTMKNIPFSGIFIFGPEHVIVGIRELVEEGMIRHLKEGEDDVFFPTPALVSHIMQKQEV